MKYLIPACAALLSACTVQHMERFTVRTVEGKEIILVCPVERVKDRLQLVGGRCFVDMTKENR